MTQARSEVVTRQDMAPGMKEHLSEKIGRDLTIEEIQEEGSRALEYLREEGKCPVCREGEVGYVPAVSCGIEYRCSYDPCRASYTGPEVRKSDFPDVKGTLFLFGYRILSDRHDLQERLTNR